jgi:hypothetical protein
MVSFTPRPLYPQRKSPHYPQDRRLGGPQTRSGCGDDKGSPHWPYRKSNLGRPARSLVTILTELPWLPTTARIETTFLKQQATDCSNVHCCQLLAQLTTAFWISTTKSAHEDTAAGTKHHRHSLTWGSVKLSPAMAVRAVDVLETGRSGKKLHRIRYIGLD